MSAFDTLRSNRNRLDWMRIDPDMPGGLHRPKLKGDIGWDLEAMDHVLLGPGEGQDVRINAALALPDNVYADVRNRSSMARRGIYVDQNLIDTGYRGPLFVFLRNMGITAVNIQAGERIAQLVFHQAHRIWDQEVAEIDTNTERAAAGFGSTGA